MLAAVVDDLAGHDEQRAVQQRAAIAIGQLGLPRRYVTVMYAAWALGVALLAGYGLMTTLWQGMLIGLLTASLFEVGSIIWVTLLQTEVPQSRSSWIEYHRAP